MDFKKEYMTPKMSVLVLKSKSTLLSCSGDCEDINDFKESDDEFGFVVPGENDRQA